MAITFRVEDDPEPIQIATSLGPALIFSRELFLRRGDLYHRTVSKTRTPDENITVVFSSDGVQRASPPEGDWLTVVSEHYADATLSPDTEERSRLSNWIGRLVDVEGVVEDQDEEGPSSIRVPGAVIDLRAPGKKPRWRPHEEVPHWPSWRPGWHSIEEHPRSDGDYLVYVEGVGKVVANWKVKRRGGG